MLRDYKILICTEDQALQEKLAIIFHLLFPSVSLQAASVIRGRMRSLPVCKAHFYFSGIIKDKCKITSIEYLHTCADHLQGRKRQYCTALIGEISPALESYVLMDKGMLVM